MYSRYPVTCLGTLRRAAKHVRSLYQETFEARISKIRTTSPRRIVTKFYKLNFKMNLMVTSPVNPPSRVGVQTAGRTNDVEPRTMCRGRSWHVILERIHRVDILTRNFDVTNGKSACEASSATWNLSTNSAFALGSRKATENPDGFGRPQDLPDANWLLANSPTLNGRTLTLVPIWLLLYLKKVYMFVLQMFLAMCILWMNICKEVTYAWMQRIHLVGRMQSFNVQFVPHRKRITSQLQRPTG
jgi:hypothetical protein